MRTKTAKKRILAVLAVLLFAASAFCGSNAVREAGSRQKEKADFIELARLVEVVPNEPKTTEVITPSSTPIGTENTQNPSEAPSAGASPSGAPHTAQSAPQSSPDIDETAPNDTPSEPSVAHEASAPFSLHDIHRLIEMNGDSIGWLSIDGTVIDYPVMHTPQEPQKYLRLNFYGQHSSSGVPFIDHRCNLKSGNIIIYGHNMRNGTMFASLKNYLHREHALAHPTILFETETAVHEFKVFAAAIVSTDDPWYGFICAESEEAFNRAVQRIYRQCNMTSGAMPEFGDRILTLSTCHSSGPNNRLIVLAAEERPAIPLCWNPDHPIFKFHIDRRG